MKIAIVAVGSRGDVQPAIAFGLGLQEAGHEVKILAGIESEDFVKRYGLAYGALPLNVFEMLQSGPGLNWMEVGSKSPLEEVNAMKALFDAHGMEVARCIVEEVRGSDVLMSGFQGCAYTHSVAEFLGIPHLIAFLQPWQMTRQGTAIMHPIMARRNTALNLVSGLVTEWGLWQMYKETIEAFRTELGLSPMRLRGVREIVRQSPALCGFSAHLVPQPEDWNEQTHITGFWFLDGDEEYTPPEDLVAFINAGEAPVYIGFGSMSSPDAQGTTQLFLNAVEQVGCRAIISKGWAGYNADEVPDNVYMLQTSVSHEWLFPQMAGLVHHGGAGTTANGLRAGVPAAIVPHIVDQGFWGRRLDELGAGTEPIPRHKLTSDQLANAIHKLTTDNSLQVNAAELSERIREENGVRSAVNSFEILISRL